MAAPSIEDLIAAVDSLKAIAVEHQAALVKHDIAIQLLGEAVSHGE